MGLPGAVQTADELLREFHLWSVHFCKDRVKEAVRVMCCSCIPLRAAAPPITTARGFLRAWRVVRLRPLQKWSVSTACTVLALLSAHHSSSVQQARALPSCRPVRAAARDHARHAPPHPTPCHVDVRVRSSAFTWQALSMEDSLAAFQKLMLRAATEPCKVRLPELRLLHCRQNTSARVARDERARGTEGEKRHADRCERRHWY